MPKITIKSCILILACFTQAGAKADDARTLSFFHTHSLKSLEVTYYQDGQYLPGAMKEVRVFLADWRDQHQHDIDPKVMDILWRIQQVSGNTGTFEVISAYRSPATNAYLRGRSKGVAQNSQHLKGKAIDVRLRGMETSELRDIALDLKLGGVGYYKKSDFVHVDSARVRRW